MKKLPWPKQGDKAFSSKGRGKSFNVPNVSYWPLPQHASAFLNAANMLVCTYEEAPQRPYHDNLVFPVVYLYRHFLELKLKDLITLGVRAGLLKRDEVKEA